MDFPEFAEPDCQFHWQMTNCERFALSGLLQRLRPALSLEIGTYQGGSLQVLAKYSGRVVSVDIDPEVATRLSPSFHNVEFLTGNSGLLLPEILAGFERQGVTPAFILIDGDHSKEGVCRDINALLALRPRQRTVVVLHDSFNPECRAGMLAAAWADCPYVHHVELDYIPGVFHEKAYDTAPARTMWAGFACAILEPSVRTHPLRVGESQRGLFETMRKNSSHCPPSLVKRIVGRIFPV